MTTKELQCMMPSCRLAPELRSQIPHVFRVISHSVGLVVLCAEIPIHLLSTHQTYSLLPFTRIPCRGSHCENGRVRCCIYIMKHLAYTRKTPWHRRSPTGTVLHDTSHAKSCRSATDNEHTTLARHRVEDAFPGCERELGKKSLRESLWFSEQTGPWGSASEVRQGFDNLVDTRPDTVAQQECPPL